MFSLSVVCTLNTQLKLLPFKQCMVLRQKANGNFNLTPTVYYLAGQVHAASEANYQIMHAWLITFEICKAYVTSPGSKVIF